MTRNALPPLEPTLEADADSAQAPAVSVDDLALLQRASDRYEFLSVLGQGGMGIVYEARDRRLGRRAALKFLRGVGELQTQRFLREAQAQASVRHPGICEVYEAGEMAGRAYIAMQMVDGLPLDRAAWAMSLADKLQVVREVAGALHAAHQMGIIHRDIKPSNIMVEQAIQREGGVRYRPIVMDFGLAREAGGASGLTETGDVLGTPAYMPPEQARGDVKVLDRRADVYSLGATLYELVVGEPPFTDESVFKLLLKVINDEPVPLRQRNPALPEALDTIVGKCLRKEPAQRYPTADALREDLGRFLAAQRIVARRESLGQRLWARTRRHKALVALGGALCLSLLTLLGYSVQTRVAGLRKERLAQEQAMQAERLAQEIKDLEWLLRSSRQLPLHDLEREKVIVRRRMVQLQAELMGYGARNSGLAHYALGRGYLALHEYPQALIELQQALQLGVQSAEVHYALGFVLGKHFEQSMYEARLSGGGEWARKQLKDIEPRYLTPAIAALQRSRSMKLATPQYLEGLIAFYQRDYPGALLQAAAAQREAPWLYEASKLAGDVHLEQALQARDSGRREEAEREFASAVRGYEEAAAIGASDSEVYEGLAEAWVRKLETSVTHGQPTTGAYAAAVVASDQATLAEPQGIGGRLKKAQAALMTMSVLASGLSSPECAQRCLSAAKAVLAVRPGHPYASDVAANCNMIAAEAAQARAKIQRRCCATLWAFWSQP